MSAITGTACHHYKFWIITRYSKTWSIFSTYRGITVSSYNKGTLFHGDNLFVASVPLLDPNGATIQKVGDVWLQVTDVNGTAKSGWVAVIHMGGNITTLKDNGAPPPADSITIDIVAHDVKVAGDEYSATGIKLTKTK